MYDLKKKQSKKCVKKEKKSLTNYFKLQRPVPP